MSHLSRYKLDRVLTRFPWRRRKPRAGKDGTQPIELKTGGREVWADPRALGRFEDPAPALVYIALRADKRGHEVIRALVDHHAEAQGVELPDELSEATKAGIQVLKLVLETVDLDPEQHIGEHSLDELITSTWAIAIGSGPS